MLVIDSCVAIKWFVNEPDSDEAARILSSRNVLIAPDLALAELANGLRRKERQSLLPADAVREATEEAQRMFDNLIPSSALILQAVALSQRLDHSVYDCHYLAVAQRFGAPLITSDRKLLAKVRAGGSQASTGAVIALADWKG